MKRMEAALVAGLLLALSGCTNLLYQGEITAADAFGRERHFVLYWMKTDPLLGQAKAGPAVLLTECSPGTRIDFADQPEGIVFRGTPGFDRLPGEGGAGRPNEICGRITGYRQLSQVKPGSLSLSMACEPVSDEFAVSPRNYLAPRPEPYQFPVTERAKRWSLSGETLPGPPVPPCKAQ